MSNYTGCVLSIQILLLYRARTSHTRSKVIHDKLRPRRGRTTACYHYYYIYYNDGRFLSFFRVNYPKKLSIFFTNFDPPFYSGLLEASRRSSGYPHLLRASHGYPPFLGLSRSYSAFSSLWALLWPTQAYSPLLTDRGRRPE